MNACMQNKTKQNHLTQIASELLLPLDRFEQRFEVASTKAREIVALDDLNKDSRPIHEVL